MSQIPKLPIGDEGLAGEERGGGENGLGLLIQCEGGRSIDG